MWGKAGPADRQASSRRAPEGSGRYDCLQFPKALTPGMHSALTTKGLDFYFQSTNTLGAPSPCLLLSDPSPQIRLPPSGTPSGPGCPEGPSGWAWTQPGSQLTPVTIYGHSQAPLVPAPSPACFPGTEKAWAGPRSSRPIHGHVPSWMPGPRATGEGQDSCRETHGAREAVSQRSMLPSSLETEKRPPLKGLVPLTGSCPLPGRGHPERARRPHASCTEAPA